MRIRRTVLDYDSFEDDVRETVHHLDELGADGVQVFVLAASAATARFAGRLGLGLALAGHVAPAGIEDAVRAYRECFRPRSGSPGPWTLLCLPIVVAGSDDEARWWFRSVQRRYLDRLRTGGAPMLPPQDAELDWSASERYRVEAMLAAGVVGSDRTVESCLQEVRRRLAPDEIMAMTDLPDTSVTMNSHVRLAGIAATMGD
jgi:alkanesulfonate monooxygenase SsuD/methylene tetrahydromethanopterin reductase-like flavin-dependent oxidoreductase (luciferase family)